MKSFSPTHLFACEFCEIFYDSYFLENRDIQNANKYRRWSFQKQPPISREKRRKKIFLKISHNSQENTCARVSFLIKLFVNFAKFSRTPFLQDTSRRLFLIFATIVNGWKPEIETSIFNIARVYEHDKYN